MRTETKHILIRAGFSNEVKLVEQGLCPFCKKPVKKEDFKDELSKKEFEISGMCQTCQDNVFRR